MKRYILILVVILTFAGCARKGHIDLKIDTNGDGHHDVDMIMGRKKYIDSDESLIDNTRTIDNHENKRSGINNSINIDIHLKIPSDELKKD